MKKNTALLYTILGILFAIFNILAFVIPSEKTATFWVAYGFTAVSFVAQIFIFQAFKKTSDKKRFAGISALFIGTSYLFLQVILFFTFKILSFIPVWVSVVICSFLFAFFLILSISVEIAKSEIVAVENKANDSVLFIKMLQTEAELALEKEEDSEIKQELQKLIKAIKYSDPMNNGQLSGLENRIKEKVCALSSSADKKSDICEIQSLLSERNKKCKTLK